MPNKFKPKGIVWKKTLQNDNFNYFQTQKSLMLLKTVRVNRYLKAKIGRVMGS